MLSTDTKWIRIPAQFTNKEDQHQYNELKNLGIDNPEPPEVIHSYAVFPLSSCVLLPFYSKEGVLVENKCILHAGNKDHHLDTSIESILEHVNGSVVLDITRKDAKVG